MLDLSKLSPVEKKAALKLLDSLGIDIDKAKPTKVRKKVVVLKSYINRYENRCATCNNIEFEYYHMKQNGDADFLSGLRMKESDVDSSMDIKTHVRKLVTCSRCYDRLSKLPKVELIRMLIKEKIKWI